ncbi:MAG: hypothetical protein GY853_06755 [PVC group bacterium]|nr:hypothetical protein [PVC group bacterium]
MDQFTGEDLDCETHVVACDYIQYRVEREKLKWHDCPSLPEPSLICQTWRTLCNELEASNSKELIQLAKELPLTPTTLYIDFLKLALTIFESGINWGRIVALYTFGGILATSCI